MKHSAEQEFTVLSGISKTIGDLPGFLLFLNSYFSPKREKRV